MSVKLKYMPSKLTLRQMELYSKIYPKSIKLLLAQPNIRKQKDIITAIQRYEDDINSKFHNDKDFYKTLKGDSDITGSKKRKSKSKKRKSKSKKRSKKRSKRSKKSKKSR